MSELMKATLYSLLSDYLLSLPVHSSSLHAIYHSSITTMYLSCYTLERTRSRFLFFFNDTATTEIYTLSLHDALPISDQERDYFMQRYHDVISSFGGKTSYEEITSW